MFAETSIRSYIGDLGLLNLFLAVLLGLCVTSTSYLLLNNSAGRGHCNSLRERELPRART